MSSNCKIIESQYENNTFRVRRGLTPYKNKGSGNTYTDVLDFLCFQILLISMDSPGCHDLL